PTPKLNRQASYRTELRADLYNASRAYAKSRDEISPPFRRSSQSEARIPQRDVKTILALLSISNSEWPHRSRDACIARERSLLPLVPNSERSQRRRDESYRSLLRPLTAEQKIEATENSL